MLDVSLERAEPIGLLLHAIGTNGGLTGARLIYSMINGNTGDTGDTSSEEKPIDQQSTILNKLSRDYVVNTK